MNASDAVPMELLAQHDLAALLKVDFHDPTHRTRYLAATATSEAHVGLLRSAQRVARIVPLTGPTVRAGGFEPRRAVARLLERGLVSAHHVAELPASDFAAEHADAFGGDEQLAREAHRRAVQVRAAVRHAAANVRDLASPYVRALHGSLADPGLSAYLEGIPGYQELFGSLNYLACDHCGSIFGPAAYLFDLLRITERYVTAESRNLPEARKLRTRRPDLYELPLTCENTDSPIPTVTVVDEVLKKTLGAGVVRKLATAVFPFATPYNEPRTSLTGALARLGVPLAAGAASLLARDPDRLLPATLPLAAAALDLSPETVRFLTTPRTGDADVAAEFGLAGLADHLPAAGLGTITVEAHRSTATGRDGGLAGLKPGQQFGLAVAGRLQIRTVTKAVDDTTVQVDVPWTASAVDASYTVYPLEDLSTVPMFRERTAITDHDALTALFVQGLSTEEQRTAVADRLWINNTGENQPPLHISPDTGGDTANPVWRISGLTAVRLDRLSRLLRLSRAVGVRVDVLDWLIVQCGATRNQAEITPELLINLAGMRQLADAVGPALVDVAAFAHPLKTSGRGTANELADPFDLIFNAAAVRRGTDPYAPDETIPFNPARPLAWPVAANGGGTVYRGTVTMVESATAVLGSDASDRDGAYVGMEVSITSGTGEGQRAVIMRYDGPARRAMLYTPWKTLPSPPCDCVIAAVPGLAERLAAALRVGVADLRLLGAHLGGSPDAVVLLTLDTLTELWRLATMAACTGLPIEAFLMLLRLVGAAETKGDGLARLETMITAAAWLTRTRLTVDELDYVLNGTHGRSLRLAYDPAELPAAVAAIAAAGSGTLLTAPALVQTGFDPGDAADLVVLLAEAGFIDDRGVVLPARDRFAATAAHFPISTDDFVSENINAGQAAAAVAELREQYPRYLNGTQAGSSVLTWDYRPGAVLAGLFTGIGGADAVVDMEKRRAFVSAVLDHAEKLVSFTEFAGLAPLTAVSFRGDGIGDTQSRAVYDCLLSLDEPVLKPSGLGAAQLSARYAPKTVLGPLFDSPAAGQRAAVKSYEGTSRIATIDGSWRVLPDAFTIYEVWQPSTTGTAVAATRTTIRFQETASADDGAYVGQYVVLTSGPGAGERLRVRSYAGSTRTATMASEWDTMPTEASGYRVERLVTSGSARGGTSNTITLQDSALPDDGAYNGCIVALVEDADPEDKIARVRGVLDATAGRVSAIRDAVAEARAAQNAYATQALASFLGMPATRLPLLLPLAVGRFTLDDDLPGLLTPPTGGAAPPNVADLADALVRAGLAADRTGLDDTALAGLSRRPDHFGLGADGLGGEGIGAWTFETLRLLGAVPDFVGLAGTTTESLVSYLNVWTSVVGERDKRSALADLTGWDFEQLAVIGKVLKTEEIGWQGIGTLPGLGRLHPPMEAMGTLAADAAFLVRIADAAKLPSLDGGTRDKATWEAYESSAEAALALVPGRFGDSASTVADGLARDLAVATRDALVGYALTALRTTVPGLRTSADLFEYLLIDVETGGCTTTSRVAQAITSVQLYLQRVRLGLEPEASAAAIYDSWWDWISTYRMWEANRKVFLYPENYIDPSLRRGASPEFAGLLDALLQGRPTDDRVAQAVTGYFDSFENIATLVHVGAHRLSDDNDNHKGGQIDQRSYLVARTPTKPYDYYVRSFTRSLLHDSKSVGPGIGESIHWQPWRKVEARIDASEVTPVFAFDRLFLFWTEIEPTKSSKVSGAAKPEQAGSKTESSWTATLNYTCLGSTGAWIAAQQLGDPQAIRVMPNDKYAPAENKLIKEAYADTEPYWARPYAQQIPRGLIGSGWLAFDRDSHEATGTGTAFTRQVHKGDSIWVAGRTYRVSEVISNTRLTVATRFESKGTGRLFKVVPAESAAETFSPFVGRGLLKLQSGKEAIDGTPDTSFVADIAVGDRLLVEGQSRTVTAIPHPNKLEVDYPFTVPLTIEGAGTVRYVGGKQFVGRRTLFTSELIPGDLLVLGDTDFRRYEVERILDDENLTIKTSLNYRDEEFHTYRIDRKFFHYKVAPSLRGDERLMVFFGPNLDVKAALPAADTDPAETNDGDDPFIASRNQFNAAVYGTLKLKADVKKNFFDPAGDLLGQPVILLDQTLDHQKPQLFALGAHQDPNAYTPPVRVVVDRENDVLFVQNTRRPLVALYWGDSTPTGKANQITVKGTDYALAYHAGHARTSLYGYGNQIGWYLFNSGGQSFWIARNDDEAGAVAPSTFLRPLAMYDPKSPTSAKAVVVEYDQYTTSNVPLANAKFRFTRLTTSVVSTLKTRLLAGGFPLLFSPASQSLHEPPFNRFYQVPEGAPPAALDTGHLPPDLMDFAGSYGLYFWELFFHLPLMVAGQLAANQDFAGAKRWYEYVYDPQAQPTDDDAGEDRFWRFRPFREGMTLPGLRSILTNQFEITVYHDDPFDPDAIGRLRVSAYAKATVLKYVDNLIKWGDALFREETRESIAQATNLYVLAEQLLGRRPEAVGTLPPHTPRSYAELTKGLSPDHIPEFLIELENSSLIPVCGDGRRYADAPINDINAYFCVPENAELTGYWDRIEDRLFKIRNCLTIDGAERALALFAPPIDVRALVASYGTAGAVGGLSGIAGGPVPNLRFTQLVAYARGLTEDVVRLGSALLGALERKDAEALATLQVAQEGRILELAGTIRQQQVDMVDRQRAEILAAREGAVYRSQYYADLISAGLNRYEDAELGLQARRGGFQLTAMVLRAAASGAYLIPQAGSPFALTFGGEQIGRALEQTAAGMETTAQLLGLQSETVGLSGQWDRRAEDWRLQKALADFDVAQFDAQLAANETGLAIAESEVAMAARQQSQNAAVGDFLRTRFTNQALYTWLANRLSTTYFQTYTLALDIARAAQRALRHELGADVPAVTTGGWDDLRRGLTAGETLMLSLDRMEAAYATKAERSLEITKTISLAELDPVAFLRFLRTGEAVFSFDEALFDADFPGHYRRRIKTLSVSVPAVLGPYQNLHATLTQTANRVVLRPSIEAVKFLLGEGEAVEADLIEHNVRVRQSIAVSLGQDDSGLFQVDLGDPLLLPFEQTGAVSNWHLSMPPSTNPIDPAGIGDVVFELRYTAVDGGAAFRDEVAALPRLRRRTWNRTTQVARQDADAWHLFMTGPVHDQRQTLALQLGALALANVARAHVTGFFLRLVVPDKVKTSSRDSYLDLTVGTAPPFAFSPDARGSVLVAFDAPVPLSTGVLPVTLGFDLRSGCTPNELKKNDRLSAESLLDIELVLFMTGEIAASERGPA